MRLAEAVGGEGLAEGFLDLAPAIYRDDPYWIPEDSEYLEACFGHASPWLRRGPAHTFCVPGRARASVFRPSDLEIDGAPAAFFGHFESAGDERADARVIGAAREWAHDVGAARLYGPVDLSPTLGHCLRLERAPRSRRYLDEPYNPARYGDALRALGLREDRRYAGIDCDETELRMLAAVGAPVERALLAEGYRLEPLTPAAWEQRRAEVHTLANAVFAGNFGFIPLTRTEFDAVFDARWARRLDPRLSVLAIAPDGRVAGFSPYTPDYVPLMVKGAGATRVALRDVSFADHATALSRLGEPAAVARASGVDPGHQRRGLITAMSTWSARRAVEHGLRVFYGRVVMGSPALRLFKNVRATRRSYALFVTDGNGSGR